MASTNQSTLPRIELPARAKSPFRSILIRLIIVLACIVVTAILVYVDRDGYRDNDKTGLNSLLDAFYYATVTLSTTGYGDVTPVSEGARLVNIVVITPLRFLFLIVLVGTTIEALTERSRREWRFARWRRKVKRHTVVVGYGMKGRSAVSALKDQGIAAESIVVVYINGGNVKSATADGCVGVGGHARSASRRLLQRVFSLAIFPPIGVAAYALASRIRQGPITEAQLFPPTFVSAGG